MTDVASSPAFAGEQTPATVTPLKILGRDDIKKNTDVATAYVDVPEWGGRIKVRALSGVERDAFEGSMLKGTGRKQKVVTDNVRAKLVSLACIDEEGKPLFDPKDSQWLGTKSAAALHRVYQAAAKLSGLTDEDVEEIVKASGGDLFGDG